jgi:cytochrome P450
MIPRRSRLPSIIQLAAWGLRPAEFMRWSRARYGECFVWRLPGMAPIAVFSSPAAVKELFSLPPLASRAGEFNQPLGPVLGKQSLLTMNGPEHVAERKALMPVFHGERLRGAFEAIHSVSALAAQQLARNPSSLRLIEVFQELTLEIIERVIFGASGNDLDQLRPPVIALLKSAENPSWMVPMFQRNLLGVSPWAKLVRARGTLDHWIFEYLRRRLAEPQPREDLLALLMSTHAAPDSEHDLQAIRDELMTILLAGHETTTNALAFVFYYVLADAQVHARLQRELEEAPLEAEALTRLPYLDAVIKEALRLAPVIPMAGRFFIEPTEIAGYSIGAGTFAAGAAFLVHRDPQVWDEPERFNPDRFLAKTYAPHEYLPFGGGARRCIGAAFATAEMKIIAAHFFRALRFQLPAGYRFRIARNKAVLSPSGGLPVSITAATATA